jgi:hypothetical protein
MMSCARELSQVEFYIGFFLVHLTMLYLSEKANASAEDAFFNQRQL